MKELDFASLRELLCEPSRLNWNLLFRHFDASRRKEPIDPVMDSYIREHLRDWPKEIRTCSWTHLFRFPDCLLSSIIGLNLCSDAGVKAPTIDIMLDVKVFESLEVIRVKSDEFDFHYADCFFESEHYPSLQSISVHFPGKKNLSYSLSKKVNRGESL